MLYVTCFAIGTLFGVFCSALMCVAKDADTSAERHYRQHVTRNALGRRVL